MPRRRARCRVRGRRRRAGPRRPRRRLEGRRPRHESRRCCDRTSSRAAGGPQVDVEVFAGLLADACRERDSAPCAEAYKVAYYIVRDAQLDERALTYYASPIIDTKNRAAQKHEHQKNAYFDEALFQYPWELVVNGWWINRHDPRPRDAAGNRLGYLTPHTAQK